MGLRINTNVPALNTRRNLESKAGDSGRSLARLSSGERIVNAGDDAAGLALSTNFESEVRSLRQAQRNAGDGVSIAQTAEGALNETSNLLIRLRELSVQASSDTLGDGEREILNREFSSLKEEINRISASTTYNGRALLDGSGGTLSFQVGAGGGDRDRIDYDAGRADASASGLGISGAGVSSKSDALGSLSSIDSALNSVNLYRSDLGALQNRLQSAGRNVNVAADNLAEARSRIADTDIAEEASNLAKNNILQNAGVAVLAQANQSPASALRLL